MYFDLHESTGGMDFCYDPDDAGGDDDDDPPGNTNKVTYKGRDFCTSARPCGRCVGDCDGDRGCAGDLRCFQRSGNEPIPGCAGGDDEATREFACLLAVLCFEFCLIQPVVSHHVLL